MPELTDVLANAIRAERSRRRLTQVQLAAAVGMHPATLSEVERGKRAVTVADLVRFCRALGLPLVDLLRGADPEDLRTLGL